MDKQKKGISIFQMCLLLTLFLSTCNGYGLNETTNSDHPNGLEVTTKDYISNVNTASLEDPIKNNDQDICWPWHTVDEYFLGQSICVYGTIEKMISTPSYPIIAGFSKDPGTLVIRGEYGGFNFSKNQCVVVRGLLEKDSTYLYMNSEEIDISISFVCD
ncbi:hypothetical protein ACFLV7_14920 [Chloroflexota bacterium]